MLLHGYRQSNHWWKPSHWSKLSEQLPAWLIERLVIFRELIEGMEKQVNALTLSIAKEAPQAKPLGMGELTHEVIAREVGDWQRFKRWRQVGSYAGLTGGVSRSGQQQADLSITKAGNKRLRTVLIELSWRLLAYQSDYWLVKKWKHVLLNPEPMCADANRRSWPSPGNCSSICGNGRPVEPPPNPWVGN
jgi:transposase